MKNNCSGASWQVTLFTRGKAPITQPLPGESDQDYADFSSKVFITLMGMKRFLLVISFICKEMKVLVLDSVG
jgi:hypothetical protein